ncbi:hypothetical protein [Rhizorhabdus argentea]|uniref:hypothetical protein n=1 Tax=Rhizorhabdus argentea TaxID=1387174 RepID=UPI0030EF5514
MVQASGFDLNNLASFSADIARYEDIQRLVRLTQPPMSFVDQEFVKATIDAQCNLREAAEPFGGTAAMMRAYAEQQALLGPVIEEYNRVGLSIDQALRWQSTIADAGLAEIIKSYQQPIDFSAEVEAMLRTARETIGAGAAFREIIEQSRIGMTASQLAELHGTEIKMSVLAGLRGTVGSASLAFDSAWHGLLGDWRAYPGLPISFDEDISERQRLYRKADVDPGLIEIKPPALVEVVVSSGLLGGAVDDEGTVATISFGGVTMAIRSSESRNDAYRALAVFEEEMRVYLADRFETVVGPDWFKARIDPKMAEKMKGVRAAALKAGEVELPKLSYLDLGDLLTIVTNRANWREVFEDVFRNRIQFRIDMERLVALRRPTMHARPVDGVQLCEMILVMSRLSDAMDDDGHWKTVADSDD